MSVDVPSSESPGAGVWAHTGRDLEVPRSMDDDAMEAEAVSSVEAMSEVMSEVLPGLQQEKQQQELHHHCTITAPSLHHHCTITTAAG